MSTSQYPISVSLQSGGVIFTGFLTVDNATNLVVGVYETIEGNTNFSNNILIPTGTGAPYGTSPDGFSEYIIDEFLGPSHYCTYDNAYINGWINFDNNGIIIRSMSYYPTDSSFNLYGDLGTNNNLGTLIYNNGTSEYSSVPVVTTIQPIPISDICFPAKTPITTDQGNIPIEKIDPKIHTINDKPILAITQTISQDNYLVCFEKNALGLNCPNEKTIMSRDHKIYYNGKMIEACKFIGYVENVSKIEYTGDILYNVLMEDYDKMQVNNLVCETLHPENTIAKLYRSNLTEECKNKYICMMNEHILKTKYVPKNIISINRFKIVLA